MLLNVLFQLSDGGEHTGGPIVTVPASG